MIPVTADAANRCSRATKLTRAVWASRKPESYEKTKERKCVGCSAWFGVPSEWMEIPRRRRAHKVKRFTMDCS